MHSYHSPGRKIPDFSRLNCRQYVEQMHIYYQILREHHV